MDMLPQRLKSSRIAKGLSQKELAKLAGPDQTVISRALDTTLSDLIGDADREKKKTYGPKHPVNKLLKNYNSPEGLRCQYVAVEMRHQVNFLGLNTLIYSLMDKPLFSAILITAFLMPATNGIAWSDDALSPAREPVPGRYPPPPPPNPDWRAGPWGSPPWGYHQPPSGYRAGIELNRVQEELAAYRTELDKAHKDLQQGEVAIQEARAALDQAYTEHHQNLELQNELSEQLAAASTENVALKSRVTQLTTELATANASLAENREQAAVLTEEHNQLQNTLAGRVEQLANLKDELLTVTTDWQQAQSGMDTSHRELAESQARAQLYKNRLDNLNTRLEDQKQAMLQARQLLAKMSSARDSLRADLSTSAEQLTRVQITLAKAQVQAEQLRQARNNSRIADAQKQPESALRDEPAPAESGMPDAVEIAALESGDSDRDGVPDSIDLCPGTLATATVESTGCTLNATIPLEGVSFRYNSHELTDSARLVLERVAGILSRNAELRLEVAGHTDSQGNAAYNQWLSQQRAQAVRDYLITRGLDPENISARGYGAQQPVADNTTVEGLVQNRRVELRRLP